MRDWAGTVVATTPRLVLRTFREADLPLYAALNADPAVVRHLGGVPFTREYSDDIAAWAQESFERQGFGLLAVQLRSDGQFLGMCGLHRHSSHLDEVEVAWRFASEHWGNGYATEAATGWMDHGFDHLRLDHIISMTDEPQPAQPGRDAPVGHGLRPGHRDRRERCSYQHPGPRGRRRRLAYPSRRCRQVHGRNLPSPAKAQ